MRTRPCDASSSCVVIGPLIASALVAMVGDGRQFKNGRQMAASLGLTPRQHSSGGKEQAARYQQARRQVPAHADDPRRTFGTAHGARQDRPPQSLGRRISGAPAIHNVAAIALANKMARIAWAMMRHGTELRTGARGRLNAARRPTRGDHPPRLRASRVMANRSNRRRNSPRMSKGAKPDKAIGSRRANSPLWPDIGWLEVISRPDIREQSYLVARTRSASK